jgi:hypothetical protein
MADYLMRVVQSATGKGDGGRARPAPGGLRGLPRVMLGRELPGAGRVGAQSSVDEGETDRENALEAIAGPPALETGLYTDVASDPPAELPQSASDEVNPALVQTPPSMSKTASTVVMPRALRQHRAGTIESAASQDSGSSEPVPAAAPLVVERVRAPAEQGASNAPAESNLPEGLDALQAPGEMRAVPAHQPSPTAALDIQGSAVLSPAARAILPRARRESMFDTPLTHGEETRHLIGAASGEGQPGRAGPDERAMLAAPRSAADAVPPLRTPAKPLSHDDDIPPLSAIPRALAQRGTDAASPPIAERLPMVARSLQPEGARIHIGRVDVQVNNAPPAPSVPVQQQQIARRPHEALEARYLDRFWLRP